MKKLVSALLIVALLLSAVAALAEADEQAKINCLIDEGGYVVQIDDPEGDLGWVFESEDEDIVALYDANLIEDTFVARFEPAQDGEATVTARHYTGIACDALYTWDLVVEGGAIAECTGGSTAMSPAEEEIDPWVSGEWIERDTQFTALTIEKNPERGWDVEAASPLTHGAFIFKATVCYDCDVEGFVYDKGKFWDVPITEDDAEIELGEAKVAGSTGTFVFGGASIEAATLTWHDDGWPEDVVFVRAEPDGEDDDGAYYTFEGSGVAMKLPADFQFAEGEPVPNVFFEAFNDDVLLQVQPVEGDYADLDALMEHFNGLETVVRSEMVSFNGVDLVYSEGADDDAMIYSLVSTEGTSYAFVFIPQNEDGANAILRIISTVCPSDNISE